MSKKKINFEKNKILGIPFSPFSFQEAIDNIVSVANETDRLNIVYTPNVHHVYLYRTNQEFQNAYDNCTFSLIDGIPIIWAHRFFKKTKLEKISGSDIFTALFPKIIDENLKVLLLGGAPGVAERAARTLAGNRFSNEQFHYLSPPFDFDKNENENEQVIRFINNIEPNIVFVALGAPKGELWISRNSNRIRCNVVISVGGSFDFIAGTQKRAPPWMQKRGLEWFYRLLSNPRRLWKRYLLTNSFFIYLCFMEAIKTI